MKKMLWLILILLLLAAGTACFALRARQSAQSGKTVSEVTLYDAPSTLSPSKTAKLFVNGAESFVYSVFVNPGRENKGNYDVSSVSRAPMAYFDLVAGAARIDIELTDQSSFPELTSATVSPLGKGIEVQIEGRHARFSIAEPGQYIVQFNGTAREAFHLFVNAPEEALPDKTNPNVLWIEPGEWTIPDGIQLKSGQTLYLSPGAVVHTTVSAQFGSNIKIRGRGMIDGGIWESWKGQDAHIPIDFRYCSDVYVEGVILNNSNAWCFNAFETEHALVENVKIISARPNGDGFTLQSCRDFTVQNSFARTWDDSLVVKNYGQNTEGITFRHMILWTDLAQSMEVGYETNKGQQENSKISDVLFQDITVVNAFHKPVMSIHNADDALVEHIVWETIVVENADLGNGDAKDNKQLIDLTIAGSGWSSTKTRGRIQDVQFKDITVLQGLEHQEIRLMGFDETHAIDGVTLQNLTVYGTPVTSLEDLQATIQFARNVEVRWEE
ncbi:MAG: hypothetical protein GX417_13225 [Clostridiales bacterium]|nr:hypothetical protein [Clostridiales bacterium]